MDWQTDYPKSFPASERNTPRQVFDPALKHFARAFRLSDPAFDDEAQAERWRTARRAVTRHLLGIVYRLPQAEHLVLRGSLLLTAWLGDAAREPGDMDWVVQPSTVGIQDTWTQTLFEDIIRVTWESLPSDGVPLRRDYTVEDIWTYDRAPGKRIVFPWAVEGLPVGSVQMDFVFGETLRTPPAPVTLPEAWSHGTPVLSASPEESLAWKILWLFSDAYPQGKDLYDAVLLAERTHLPLELLHAVLSSGAACALPYESGDLEFDYIEWDEFQKEYPWVEGSAEDWIERLHIAMAPTYNGDDKA
jgi:hypothetical protein